MATTDVQQAPIGSATGRRPGDLRARDAAAAAGDVEARPARGVAAWVRTPVVVLLALTGVISSASLLTYDAAADGPRGAFSRAIAVTCAAALGLWIALAGQFGARSSAAFWTALAVLLVSQGQHYARLTNPAVRGAALVAIDTSFARLAQRPALENGRPWETETARGGAAVFENGTLRLSAPPGGTAFIRAALPPKAIPDATPLDRWRWPLGAELLRRDERVAWEGTVSRSGSYLTVFQSKRLQIQAVSRGLLISYPDARNDVSADFVAETFPADGAIHRWELRADGGRLALAVDGRPLWHAPQQGPLEELTLGEGQASAEHSGTLALQHVSYTRQLARR